MSDGIESAPAESSAPDTSTASIAEATYEQLESADQATESGDLPEAAAPETQEAAPQTPGVVLSEEEQLLAEFGFKDVRKPDGREHWIPRSKVLKMIGSGLKRGQERWATERTTIDGELKTLRGQWEQYGPVLQALDQGPEAFLKAVAPHDERYSAFLSSRSAPAQTPVQELAFPEPDLDLGNGAKTYSIEGIKQLVAHATQVAKAEAKREAEAALKPVTEREKQAQEREQQTKASESLQTRTRATMAEAQSWPHFGKLPEDGTLTPFQADVLKELQADSDQAKAAGKPPSLTLERAYIRVVSKLMAEDDKTKRAKILAEVNKAAKAAPSVPRSGGEVPPPTKAATTSEIAARALARLEGA